MFSLIITIISIALVAGLTVATLFYGGAAFTQNSAKSTAAALVSQAQQVASGNTLYGNDKGGVFVGTDPTGLIAGGYLSTVPTVPSGVKHATVPAWLLESTTSNVAYVSLLTTASDEVCKQINKSSFGSATIGGTASNPAGAAGGGFGSAAIAGPVSVAIITTQRTAMTSQFGCALIGTDNVVIYKG